MQYSTRTSQNHLTRTNAPLQPSLSRKNRVDSFDVNLPTVSSFRASLNGIAKTANVDLELRNAQGTIVASSHRRGRKPETIAVDNLAAGNYKLRAILKQGTRTKYHLSFGSTPLNNGTVTLSESIVNPAANPQVDLGGNSVSTATNYGKLGSNLTKISDGLSSTDSVDWYTFTLGDSSVASNRLNLGLTSDAGVYARVYSSTDLNTPLSTVISNAGNQNPLSNANAALSSGTYYVKVAPITAGSKANYNLNLSAATISDGAGNTPGTAQVINNLQPLNTSGQPFVATDFVGQGDAYDYYTFNTSTKSTLTIKFDRLNNGNFDKARVEYQLNKIAGPSVSALAWQDGQGTSLSSGFDALASSSYTVSGQLEPGTYTLGLKSYFYNGDNSYRMTVSATPIS
jgi:hypothetical protein